ncbi:MAG: hydantoinase/oxoprolinase family protein, partial [Chloroflexota bacterium]
VSRYLDSLEQQINRYRRPLFVMQSNGGVVPAAHVRKFSAGLVESGPAAGVLGASLLSRQLGLEHAVAFDMGGTTAKACLIDRGKAGETREMEVGGEGLLKGAGYALRCPGFDLEEIGAGGGSIAWVDGGGALRIGPASAGAVPGPVCYGRGGQSPTITDANVLLGYMSPVALAGGTVPIDKAAALRAFERDLCPKLNLSALDAAHGVHQVANSTMMRALRAVTTERGQNPRECTLIAFGGAGPIHAANLAADLEISRVVVPLYPGLFSALGLLVADLRFEFLRSMSGRLDQIAGEQLAEGYAKLVVRARSELMQAGLDPGAARYQRLMDVHYEKQTTELTLGLPDDRGEPADLVPAVVAHFHEEHQRIYGYQRSSEPIGLLNLRIRASAPGC